MPTVSTRRPTVAALLLAVLVLLTMGTATAHGATLERLSGFNDRVYAVTAPDASGAFYVGGSFTSYKPWQTGGGGVVDATTGAVDTSFGRVGNGANAGTIYASISDGMGGWYVGGAFTCIGGDGGLDGDCTDTGELATNNLAHINADGSVDLAFTPSVNVSVRALALSGGTLYIGGGFNQAWNPTAVAPTPCRAAVTCVRRGLAAVQTSDGLITAWDPDAGMAKIVYALAVSGSTIIAGGNFVTIGGVAHNSLAAINMSSGTPIAAWDTRTDSTVYALQISGGLLYVAGGFSSIAQNSGSTQGGCPTGQFCARGRVAALDPATGYPTAWDPQADATVRAIAVGSGVVYLGGSFTTVGSDARSRLAAVSISSGSATSWNPSASGDVQALAVAGSTVYIGGAFTKVGGALHVRAVAVDAATGAPTSWSAGSPEGAVSTFTVNGTRIYLGGAFSTLGGTLRSCLAQIDGNGDVTTWDPGAAATSGTCTVQALALDGTTLYVGGDLATLSGQARAYLGAVDTSTGNATAFNPSSSGIVKALLVSGGSIFAAGSWTTTIGGQTRPALAKLDKATGAADAAWDAHMNAGQVASAIAIDGSTLYVGGTFSAVNGQTRNRVAAVDLANGALDATWNPNVGGTEVSALAVVGSSLYLGGTYTTIGGTSRPNLGAVSTTGAGAITSWNPGADGAVSALAAQGTTLYAGGSFSSAGGATRSRVAALDTTAAGGTATSWNPGPSGGSPLAIYALGLGSSTMALGGSFTAAGAQTPQLSRKNVAVVDLLAGDATTWWLPPTPDPTPTPTPDSGAQSAAATASTATTAEQLKPSATRTSTALVVLTRHDAAYGVSVSATGRIALTLHCPKGGPACTMQGRITATLPAQARAAATVLASFSGVHVRAGARRTIELALPAAVIVQVQAAGRATLATRLHVSSRIGTRTAVESRRVTLRIPAASAPTGVTG